MMDSMGFSWIEKPYLAAMAKPRSEEELRWLRANGIDVLISLTEEPPSRRQINQAGLMLVHIPIIDFAPPGQTDLNTAVDAILKAKESGLGAVVHCGAGLGRTGTILASWYVNTGFSSSDAISKVRQLRPGSIETLEQEEAVHLFARERKRGSQKTDPRS
jgi:atypical dual specificity phosphatase